MSEIDPDSTIGIYPGSEADMIEEFDEYFETRPGSYSRSREIKRSMRLYLGVQQALDELDYDLDERSLRHFVRQAMFDKDRADR